MKMLRLALVLVPALLVWACAGRDKDLTAWDLYNGCMAENLLFSGVIACGEDRLKAHCGSQTSGATCGAAGMAVRAYGNVLVNQIENKKLTDAQARRKWSEFELHSVQEQIQIAQQAAAAAAR